MKSGAVTITGVGMASSLGWDAATACAAARAGLSRVSELDNYTLWDEQLKSPLPMIGHRVPRGAEGFQGIGRLARLGMMALQDLRSHAALSESKLARTGLFINLASNYYREQACRAARPDASDEDKLFDAREAQNREAELRAELPSLLLRFSGIAIPLENRRVVFGDQAGVFALIQEASELMCDGALDRCLIGGIDSNTDPERLGDLNELGLLKRPDNPSGVIPGEAAAFILIERLDRARACTSGSLVALGSLAVSKEPIHRFSDLPSLGVALADVVAQAVLQEGERTGALRLMIGGLNGDRWRAMEWGYASVRLRASRTLEEVEEWLPAVSFGETGAAAGAVSMVMAERALARGYVRGRRIAIWASSDSGLKAAGCVYQL
jgi:3-oxoacyl-(acyl-carrier-protein) synthase